MDALLARENKAKQSFVGHFLAVFCIVLITSCR